MRQNHLTLQDAQYKLRTHYVGAHAGLGYSFNINKQWSLDLSAKYLWTKMGGENAVVASDPIQFKSVNSHRARLDGTLNYTYNPNVNFSAGLGYEYEFDGKAKATTYDRHAIDAPSVEGGTGIISLGVNVRPSNSTNLSFDLKAQGYVGKRRGGGLSFIVRYDF